MIQFADDLWDSTLLEVDAVFEQLEGLVPYPLPVIKHGIFAFRYTEQSIEQALVQKLARQVSGTKAARLLHANGFFQEQGTLQRTLDEIAEDIQMLAIGCVNGRIEPIHRKYLNAFWQEEFADNAGDELSSIERRYPIRRKVRAYIRHHLGGGDQEALRKNSNLVSKMYSGYVHASSPHIMDMCWGDPPRFQICGMSHMPHREAYAIDLSNYLYRLVLSVGFCANAFSAVECVDRTYDVLGHLDSAIAASEG